MRISDWSSDVCSSDLNPAAQVRRLLRSVDRATLATTQGAPGAGQGPGKMERKGERKGPPGDLAGWPYASLVLLAVEPTAAPLLLISDLAEHTRNKIGRAHV